MSLTPRQKQYIWLMGSFPFHVAIQGRGVRSQKLIYALKEDELYIFGYSTPFLWLENRGLVRKLANHSRVYVLTENGEKEFRKLLVKGAGLDINRHIREGQLRIK